MYYYLGNVKREAEKLEQKFLNDYNGIGKVSLKPEQSSKQTPRYLALLNLNLILGKEGKLTKVDYFKVKLAPT